MHRHSGVAFQPRTLRRAVKKPRWGFNRSAARTHRKPSPNLDEEYFTRRLPEARKGRPKKEQVMSSVLVIGQDKRPRAPVHPGRARQLLANGQAAVYRRYPFVLILTRPLPEAPPQPLRLKIDPGRRTRPSRRAGARCPAHPVSAAALSQSTPPKGLAGPLPTESTPERAHLGGASVPLLPDRRDLIGAGAL